MYKLPKYIFLISIIRYQDNAELVDVLKDYFSGVPYIDITDYESNKQTVQYVGCDSRIIKKFVNNLYFKRDKFKILDYGYYVLNDDSTIYNGRSTNNAFNMPKKISVDSIIMLLHYYNYGKQYEKT